MIYLGFMFFNVFNDSPACFFTDRSKISKIGETHQNHLEKNAKKTLRKIINSSKQML